MVSGAMPYGHQSYHDAPVSVSFTNTADQLASASIPFLHPLPCHKFGFYTTTSVTSTVITHSASTMGAHGSMYQTHSYPQAVETYSQTHCHSLSYPADTSDPVHTALPPVTAAHCLLAPEQVVLPGVRGKHKQKTGGVKTVGPSASPSDPQSTASMPTSCLAMLLSSGTQERELVLTSSSFPTTGNSVKNKWTLSFSPGKPTLGFNNTALGTTKGQRSTSTSSVVRIQLSQASTCRTQPAYDREPCDFCLFLMWSD